MSNYFLLQNVLENQYLGTKVLNYTPHWYFMSLIIEQNSEPKSYIWKNKEFSKELIGKLMTKLSSHFKLSTV